MPNVYVDRTRASRLLAAAGLDALLLFQPENVAWLVGVGPGPAGLFRRAGAAAGLLPADQGLSLAAVMPDLAASNVRAASALEDVRYHPIWVGTMKAGPVAPDAALAAVLPAEEGLAPRPTTFDSGACYALAREQLAERGLAKARIGVDLGFVSALELERLKTALPGATILDGTEALGRIKMVKTAQEIAHLRQAVALSEIGLSAVAQAIRPGVDRARLSDAYGAAVTAAARERGAPLTGRMDYFSIGPDPWGPGKPLASGDVMKFDFAAIVAGYTSDMARTWVFGKPTRAAVELHAALNEGLDAGLALLKPGVRLSAVYETMMRTVRARGVSSYRRGHFGHGVGADVFAEEWPFISADSDAIAEAGMVLSVEAPLYVDGLGGFIVEDQVLVTNAGIDNMSTFDRALRRFD